MFRSAALVVSMWTLAALGAATAAAAPLSALPRNTLAACSWQRPGHDPYMGEMGAAIDRYTDIPVAVRTRLKERMAVRQYDDLVEIRRDRIQGRADYGPAITDMHFGDNRICHTVSRATWSDDMQERGLVYCEEGQCIIVPTVCRNVSRVTKSEPVALDHPLLFDAPGAGPAVVPAGLGAAGGPASFAELPIVPLELPPPTEGAERAIAQGTPFSGLGPTGMGLGAPGRSNGATTGTAETGLGGTTLPVTPGSSGSGGEVFFPVLIAVPEPSTWGLLLGGFAALAASGLHRRRQGNAVNTPVKGRASARAVGLRCLKPRAALWPAAA